MLERDEAKPSPAHGLLTAPDAPPRMVILGGRGSGKTTLLEAFALAFARGASFPWSAQLPDWLPVFHRIRELDKDRERQPDMWECVRQQCSRSMGGNLAPELVRRQMRPRRHHAAGAPRASAGHDRPRAFRPRGAARQPPRAVLEMRRDLMKSWADASRPSRSHMRLVKLQRPMKQRRACIQHPTSVSPREGLKNAS